MINIGSNGEQKCRKEVVKQKVLLPIFLPKVSAYICRKALSFGLTNIETAPSSAPPPPRTSRDGTASRTTPRRAAAPGRVFWGQLYKNRSSRKIDSQRLFSREQVFGKTFSLAENQFSGKTYFYTIGPCAPPPRSSSPPAVRTAPPTAPARRPTLSRPPASPPPRPRSAALAAAPANCGAIQYTQIVTKNILKNITKIITEEPFKFYTKNLKLNLIMKFLLLVFKVGASHKAYICLHSCCCSLKVSKEL